METIYEYPNSRSEKLPDEYQETLISCELELKEGLTIQNVRKLVYLYTRGIEYYELKQKEKIKNFYNEKLSAFLKRSDIKKFIKKNSIKFSPTIDLDYLYSVPIEEREKLEAKFKRKDSFEAYIQESLKFSGKIRKNSKELINQNKQENDLNLIIKNKIMGLGRKLEKIEQELCKEVVDQISNFNERKRKMKVGDFKKSNSPSKFIKSRGSSLHKSNNPKVAKLEILNKNLENEQKGFDSNSSVATTDNLEKNSMEPIDTIDNTNITYSNNLENKKIEDEVHVETKEEENKILDTNSNENIKEIDNVLIYENKEGNINENTNVNDVLNKEIIDDTLVAGNSNECSEDDSAFGHKKLKSTIQNTPMMDEIEAYCKKNMDEMYKSLEELKASFQVEINEAIEGGFPEVADGLKEDLENELENLKAQYEEQQRSETEKIRRKYTNPL